LCVGWLRVEERTDAGDGVENGDTESVGVLQSVGVLLWRDESLFFGHKREENSLLFLITIGDTNGCNKGWGHILSGCVGVVLR
jgi:hypothetical protein